LTQERKRLRRQAEHRLVDRALVEGREGFGREVGIDRIRSERDMQLGGALAQQLRRWQVRANGFLHERRKRFFAYSEQGVLGKGRLPHFVHEGPLEIVVEGLQSVLPGIPLVRHEAVENSDGHWLAVVLPVLQSASYSRGMGESDLLCQEAANLQVRVHSRGNTPEEFEDEHIAVDDRGVALLSFEERGIHRLFARAPQVPKRARGESAELTGSPFETTTAGNRYQQRLAKAFVPQRLI